MLIKHGFDNTDAAIDGLTTLSQETVSFLSPRRCRHFFAAVAPRFLQAISATPDPDRTLERFVKVTDSIGAKATLWELLRANEPTLQWMVRLCAETPYLSEILINHPGMIDELIDSLVMNRLPTRERIDSQSIQLCRGAEDLTPILQTLKASMHLMIGLRDLLGKEDQLAIASALTETAEACLRRVIDFQQEQLASRFGDPVDEDGEPVELVAVGLNKLASRELNYMSDLDMFFVYGSEGETSRRVGGPRKTLSNKQFFNQLVRDVCHILQETELFEVDLPLASGDDEMVLATSLSAFAKPFRLQTTPLWKRLLLARCRPLCGSKHAQASVQTAIQQSLQKQPWRSADAAQMLDLRKRAESTASPDNFKRGLGGLLDAQYLVAAGALKYHSDRDRFEENANTPAQLLRLASLDPGFSENDANVLADHYRSLLSMESKLQLTQARSRHVLPDRNGDANDSLVMRRLSAMLETSPEKIVERTEAIRSDNRRIFLAWMNQSSS